ncbi:MAG TPA: NADPH-dependent FMN reductase [Flavobacteriales bacterium]|nr:NADPH-dependent FMN reductase [Flavobacteriales bacterium]
MITIISSTNRHNSATHKVALHLEKHLRAREKPCKLLNFEKLPHDFIFSNFNNNSNKEFQQTIDAYIVPAVKFIFVIPEYNGGFPGILKAFIDCIPPKHFYGKQAALVGVADGHAGALRALDMFTLVLNHIRVNVHWNRPKLSDINNHFEGNFEDNDLDELYSRRVETMITDFA